MRQQTGRILEDSLFRNSKRYTDLLRFIVDRTLRGQLDDLHERIIGIEVFGRPPDYDTSADPTVRVTATEIRKRLALYYSIAERDHELRIEVPVRSYVAEFKPSKSIGEKLPEKLGEKLQTVSVDHSQELNPTTSVQSPPPSDRPAHRRTRIWYVAAPLLAVVLLFVGWLLHRKLASPSALDTFWAPLTEDPGSVITCIGVSARTTTQPQASGSDLPPQRGTVPMLDVSTAFNLGIFLQHKNREMAVVPANGTSLSDLRNGPAILVGSYENEWALRLGAGLPYRFQKESNVGRRWIEDASNPSNGNWGLDIGVPQAERDTDYGLVSRVLDVTTGHWWIGVGGLSGLGTYAAQQTIVDPGAFAKVAAQLPKDWGRKNLQIVLAVRAVHGSPGVPQVLASRTW